MELLLRIFFLPIKKFRFGMWLDAEEKRRKVVDAAGKDPTLFSKEIYEYISLTYLKHFIWFIKKLKWEYPIYIFIKINSINATKSNIPLLRVKSNKKEDEIAWNYSGRERYYLVHMIAREYGWEEKYILNLEVDDALAYVQEILTDNQLDREFMYGLSEIAYPYNKNTKKSEYKPLPRPEWMREEVKPIKRMKLPKAIVPVGLVEDAGGMEKYINETKISEPK